jgi:hypothetical protein
VKKSDVFPGADVASAPTTVASSTESNDLADLVHAEVVARGAVENGSEWRFLCPAHDDNNPSADWNYEKGLWTCRSCSAGGGLQDLANRLGILPQVAAADVDEFADKRKLKRDVLQQFGVGGVVHRNRPALRYPTPIGIDRLKFTDGAKPKYCWARTGGTAHVYRWDVARPLIEAGSSVLYIVNGEPSVWACITEMLPAICFCVGEGQVPEEAILQQLRDELVALGSIAVRVVFDADPAGRTGAAKVVEALRGAGIAEITALDLADALPGKRGGDVDDLHRQLGGGLGAGLAALPALPVGLPVIAVGGRPLRDVTADALQALRAANDPPRFFVHLGALARIRADERDYAFIERVTEPMLRYRLARATDFMKAGNGGLVPVDPPANVVQDILAAGHWDFPPLEAVVEVPVIRPNGSVFDTPGYDRSLRLVYRPDPKLSLPRIPLCPTSAELRAAVSAVTDVISDFPFTSAADFANTVALMLTPVVRAAIDGQVPMALVDKPKRGTGATLLVLVIEGIATGKATELTTAPRDDDEWRKKITALLLDGRTILFFDNVEHVLTSPSLAAALSGPQWSDRRLGCSETLSVPQRATWIATGNNLKVGGDIGRRCFWIRLDAETARPWQRQGFKHKNLLPHVLSRRGELLAALLTMARAWYEAGRPTTALPTIGGFDAWTETVGGILAFVGITDFLGNLNNLYDLVDEEEVFWEHFLVAWHTAYGERAMTVAEIAKDLRGDPPALPDLHDALPPDLAEALTLQGGASFGRRFGKALSKRDGSIFGALKLIRAGNKSKTQMWKVVKAPEKPRGGFEGFPGLIPPPQGAGGTDDSGPLAPAAGDSAETNPSNPSNPVSNDATVATDGVDDGQGVGVAASRRDWFEFKWVFHIIMELIEDREYVGVPAFVDDAIDIFCAETKLSREEGRDFLAYWNKFWVVTTYRKPDGSVVEVLKGTYVPM